MCSGERRSLMAGRNGVRAVSLLALALTTRRRRGDPITFNRV
jgi:hypothetical protein